MIEKINAVDRVPYNVLENGAIRYGVYDEDENLLRYEYIKREDEPVEVGTNVNKVLFDLIDDNFAEEEGERSRVDRYNIPEYEIGIGEQENAFNSRINPIMTANEQEGFIATAGNISSSQPYKGFDGSTSGGAILNQRDTIDAYLLLQFPFKIKPTQINIITWGAMVDNGFEVQLSKDGDSWLGIGYLANTSESNRTETFTYNGEDFFNFFRIKQVAYSSGKSSQIVIKDVSINNGKYISTYDTNLLKLNGAEFNKITEYKNNSIVNIQIPEGLNSALSTYLSINNLESKQIVFTDIIHIGDNYNLIYNGINFEAVKANNKIIKKLLTINKSITSGVSTHTITEIVNTEYDIIKVNMNYQNVYYDDNIVLNGTNILSKNTTGTTTTTATSTTNALTIHSGTRGTSYGTLLLMLEIDTKRKIFTYKVLAERESKVYYIGFGKFESLTSLVVTQGRSGESYPTALSPNIKLEVIGEKVVQ